MSASGRFFYARPNREGEPEGAGPGCGNVRFVEGRGVIPYVFKIYASIYLLSFLLAACCEVLYCWGGVSLFIGEMMAVEVMKSRTPLFPEE